MEFESGWDGLPDDPRLPHTLTGGATTEPDAREVSRCASLVTEVVMGSRGSAREPSDVSGLHGDADLQKRGFQRPTQDSRGRVASEFKSHRHRPSLVTFPQVRALWILFWKDQKCRWSQKWSRELSGAPLRGSCDQSRAARAAPSAYASPIDMEAAVEDLPTNRPSQPCILCYPRLCLTQWKNAHPRGAFGPTTQSGQPSHP